MSGQFCRERGCTGEGDDGCESKVLHSSKWSVRYPHLSNAIGPVASLIGKLRAAPNAELEARFGVVHNNKFASGVNRQTVDRIIEMMQQSESVTATSDEWCEEQDFFFTVKQRAYRTRVRYDCTTMDIVPQTICKESLGKVNIALSEPTIEMDIRVSLSTETTADVPSCVNTDLVRIKQRRRFVTSCGNWAFDFAMSWSAPNKTAAEAMQAEVDPCFEVECELIDAKRYLSLHADDDRIAASLLLKMCDLLPRPCGLTAVDAR